MVQLINDIVASLKNPSPLLPTTASMKVSHIIREVATATYAGQVQSTLRWQYKVWSVLILPSFVPNMCLEGSKATRDTKLIIISLRTLLNWSEFNIYSPL